MVTGHVIATPVVADAKAAKKQGAIGVALYHSGTEQLAGLGHQLVPAVQKYFPRPPSEAAWDFLSLALAVFAADRFVLRRDGEDGWTRVIALDVALANPTPWKPRLPKLAATLRFLTGDIWQISVRGGGAKPPTFQPRLSDRDCVCLFSGGLDSLLGALRLQHESRNPFLVSQGSPKEITPQKYLAAALKLDGFRFEGKVSEKWKPPYEGSTRARSIIFLAYGVAAAEAHGFQELFIPENGLIAINPPFTARRMGSLSTRTTHPHFLSELEGVISAVGLNVKLINPFEGISKGDMLKKCKAPNIEALAAASYSCGKGKRLNGQCGRCVPCLIRRAAFHAAGLTDKTPYKTQLAKSKRNDDVMAARIAAARASTASKAEMARWIAMAGPLPSAPARRKKIIAGVSKGLDELNAFLNSIPWR
jgi:7-cyano-7-deazaguanine synthase in queuosine biosynthesis